jgi:hypothetical protein
LTLEDSRPAPVQMGPPGIPGLSFGSGK